MQYPAPFLQESIWVMTKTPEIFQTRLYWSIGETNPKLIKTRIKNSYRHSYLDQLEVQHFSINLDKSNYTTRRCISKIYLTFLYLNDTFWRNFFKFFSIIFHLDECLNEYTILSHHNMNIIKTRISLFHINTFNVIIQVFLSCIFYLSDILWIPYNIV